MCFYVHADWMPDMNGAHNPKDPNWIVLPGKLREKFSAGQLGKLPMKSEEEVMRCYEGVEARQRMAVEEMGRCVAIGMGTWETVQVSSALPLLLTEVECLGLLFPCVDHVLTCCLCLTDEVRLC